MRALEMTARHFARRSGISVVFRENATPAADLARNVIIFPSNLAEQSRTTGLVWLLHESGHLRWSKPVDLGGRTFLHPFLNALEDVRVDLKVFAEYPAVKKTLYREYVADVLSDYDHFQSLSRISAVLMATVAIGHGFQDLLPPSAEVLEFLRDHAADLQRILSAASSAETSGELLPLAEGLALLVMGPKALKGLTQAARKRAAAQAVLEDVVAAKERCDRTSRSLARRVRYRRKRLDILAGPENKGRREQLRKEIAELEAMRSAVQDAQRDLRERARSAQQALDEAVVTLKGTDGKPVSHAQTPGLFSVDAPALEFEAPKPLGGRFEQVLVERLSETAQYVAAGSSRILPKRLHAAYTYPNRVLGASRHRVTGWKRLFFLLDASTSMQGHKASLVRATMKSVASSLERCRRAGGRVARLEYQIWAFNDEVNRIKGPQEQYNERTLDRYSVGGWTDLAGALAQMEAVMTESSIRRHRNVLFCLTDAEIQEDHVQAADSFRAGQVVYLGIGAEAEMHLSPAARSNHRRLFLRHNIQNRDSLELVLQQAIIEEVST